PVQRAVYPAPEARRASLQAPACPTFGEDSVPGRYDSDTPGRDNVRPGLHMLRASGDSRNPPAEFPVVWGDPRALTLDVRPAVGIPRQDLIEDPGPEVLEADRRRYAEWQRARQAAREAGERSSVVVKTVTEWAERASDEAQSSEPEVTVI